MAASRPLPPGPKRLWSPSILSMGGDPLAYLAGVAADHGDIACIRALGRTVILVSRPDLIQDVLVTHQSKFKKGPALHRTRFLLGDGLLTSEGAVHRRQRRLAQPAFHRGRLEGYAAVMAAAAGRSAGRWADGAVRDVSAEMSRLTLEIVARTLFGGDIGTDADRVSAALAVMMGGFNHLMRPFATLLLRSPLPAARRLRRARHDLDEVIFRLIRERRASGQDAGDLLSTLIFTEDADRPGERMSDVEVRDQAMTLFLAGHETTANALAWAWCLLARHDGPWARLQAEVAGLGDQPLTMGDLPRLPYAMAVMREVLRLYPPAWAIGRLAVEPHVLGGYDVAPGTIVIASPWVMHRSPGWFGDPLAFRPERWTDAFREGLPRFAYFPFGGGARTCIGESFAWMEMALALATLARAGRPLLESGVMPLPEPRITLRLKGPVMMRISRPEAFATAAPTLAGTAG